MISKEESCPHAKYSQSLLVWSSNFIFNTKLLSFVFRKSCFWEEFSPACLSSVPYISNEGFSIWQSSVLSVSSNLEEDGSLYVSTPFGRKDNFQMVSYFEMEAETYTCDTCYHINSEALLLYYLIPVMWWHTDERAGFSSLRLMDNRHFQGWKMEREARLSCS